MPSTAPPSRPSLDDDEHRHDWTPDPWPHETLPGPAVFACSRCPATTSPCSDCGRPLETSASICQRCLERATQLVDDCEAAYLAIPDNVRTILGLRAVRYDAGPGGGGSRAALPFGIGADEDDLDELAALVGRSTNGTVIHLMRDQDNVLGVLHDWAQAWVAARCRQAGHPQVEGEDHCAVPRSMSVFGFLRTYSLWAAQSLDVDDWHRYVDEVRSVRAKLQSIAGTTPVAEPTPCVHCGGRVVREWLPSGLDDVRRCSRCRLSWPDADRLEEAARAVVLALPATNPDLLVTRDEARRMLPGLRADTLRQVLARDRRRTDPAHKAYDPQWEPRLPVRGHDAGGRKQYRLGDVRALLAGQHECEQAGA